MTRRWLPFVCWSAVLLIASSSWLSAGHSGGLLASLFSLAGVHLAPEQLQRINFVLRKLGHLTAYGIEGALAWRALATPRFRVVRALALALLVAVLDETHQSSVPSRTGSPVDVVIDGAGAAIAIALVRTARRRSGLRSQL